MVKRYDICTAPQVKCITSEALKCGSYSFFTANTPHLPSPRKRSPDGATYRITAYYSFIDPERMKGWVDLVTCSWPTADGLPYKWLPVSCRAVAVTCRPGKVRRSKTNVFPPSYTTTDVHVASRSWASKYDARKTDARSNIARLSSASHWHDIQNEESQEKHLCQRVWLITAVLH